MKQICFEITEKRDDGIKNARKIAEGETILIGRSNKIADFVLQDPAVSRSHLRLECRNGLLFVKNSSPYGAQLDGVEINDTVEAKPGQAITLGEKTCLTIASVEANFGASEADTSKTAFPERTVYGEEKSLSVDSGIASKNSTVSPPDTAGSEYASRTSNNSTGRMSMTNSDSRLSAKAISILQEKRHSPRNLDDFEGTIELGTMIRPISDLQQSKNSKRWVEKLILVIIVLSLVGIMIALFRPKPEPKPLTWPVDNQGKYLDEKVAGKNALFAVIFPKTNNPERQDFEGGFAVKYTIDRIPFFLRYTEINLGSLVFADTKTIVEMWKNILPDKDNWLFDKCLELPIFIGSEQGVPLTVMQYFRSGHDGKFFGAAQLLRFGAVLGAVCIEVPEKDQLRAEQLILNYYMLMEPQQVKRHWQGCGSPLRRESAAELLKLANHEITRDAPATWKQTELLILDTIRKACAEQNKEIEKEASNLLEQLRTRKTTWFHAMKLKKISLERRGDKGLAKEVIRQCQLVFSSSDDRRFFEVRNW